MYLIQFNIIYKKYFYTIIQVLYLFENKDHIIIVNFFMVKLILTLNNL